jgi:hypothetical protein
MYLIYIYINIYIHTYIHCPKQNWWLLVVMRTWTHPWLPCLVGFNDSLPRQRVLSHGSFDLPGTKRKETNTGTVWNSGMHPSHPLTGWPMIWKSCINWIQLGRNITQNKSIKFIKSKGGQIKLRSSSKKPALPAKCGWQRLWLWLVWGWPGLGMLAARLVWRGKAKFGHEIPPFPDSGNPTCQKSIIYIIFIYIHLYII